MIDVFWKLFLLVCGLFVNNSLLLLVIGIVLMVLVLFLVVWLDMVLDILKVYLFFGDMSLLLLGKLFKLML